MGWLMMNGESGKVIGRSEIASSPSLLAMTAFKNWGQRRRYFNRCITSRSSRTSWANKSR